MCAGRHQSKRPRWIYFCIFCGIYGYFCVVLSKIGMNANAYFTMIMLSYRAIITTFFM